jgi:hypothetical protein
MRTEHHQSRNLDHLIKFHNNGSQRHLKVFILMRSKRNEPDYPQKKMDEMEIIQTQAM